jgi:hypothetical protein
MIKYINRYRQGKRETVDIVDSAELVCMTDKPAFRQAVNELIDNYSRSDSSAYYYESSRCCNNYK